VFASVATEAFGLEGIAARAHTAAMFAVLFEVEPRPERWDDYLHHAGVLRPELLQIDGFLDNRRFSSRRHPGRLLSLSLWRDEKSVIRWRTHGGHHAVQIAGRTRVFSDYRLRVGEVLSDNSRPLPQMRFDATEVGPAKAASVIEAPTSDTPPRTEGLLDWDMFDGITDPGSRLMLLSWRDEPSMAAWPDSAGARRLDVRIVRDYGLRSREEAPQYHAPVPR
jgi:heme-degrading monooxygenase HmoA